MSWVPPDNPDTRTTQAKQAWLSRFRVRIINPDDTRTELRPGVPQLAYEENILNLFATELRLAGVAGEQRFAKLTYLCLTSRLLEWGKPTERPVSLIGKGTSSTEVCTQRTVLKFFPLSAYFDLGSMSKRYLLYSEESLSHRILVVPEWGR